MPVASGFEPVRKLPHGDGGGSAVDLLLNIHAATFLVAPPLGVFVLAYWLWGLGVGVVSALCALVLWVNLIDRWFGLPTEPMSSKSSSDCSLHEMRRGPYFF